MNRGDLAPMKPQVYVDPRPAGYFDRFHQRARAREPDWVYTLIRILTYPYCRMAFRLQAEGVENVPSGAPTILAPTHFSGMDHWFVGMLLTRRVRFMAKSQLFRGPILDFVLSHAGAFPVRRGQRDEEAIVTALAILRRGGLLVMYPEGGRSRSGEIGESARPGIGRLALESGAPVVPVAIHGSERARNWRRLQFPAVTVRYGRPMRFGPEASPTRERQQEVADEVFAEVRALHARLAAGTAEAPVR
jgi:1-acyl-sn-glycerol-3-phosphate acyltransferase